MPPERNREISNPYLSARKEWDERYGDLITRARNWRGLAFLGISIALVQSCGLIALAMRSKTVPYIVAVDSLGRVIASGTAERASSVDDRLKRAALFEWVRSLRMVSSDGIAQRHAIERVYGMIAAGSSAQTYIGDFYRMDPPQKRAQTQSVDVQIQSILPTGDKTYEVEWVESTRDLQGEARGEARWKGAFTISIQPPTDEESARVNPLGLYVNTVSWSRVF
jgi:type IV secretion system protein VirB5